MVSSNHLERLVPSYVMCSPYRLCSPDLNRRGCRRLRYDHELAGVQHLGKVRKSVIAHTDAAPWICPLYADAIIRAAHHFA